MSLATKLLNFNDALRELELEADRTRSILNEGLWDDAAASALDGELGLKVNGVKQTAAELLGVMRENWFHEEDER